MISNINSSFPGKDFIFTDDKVIRDALRKRLVNLYKDVSDVKIIEELGVTHGTARVDMAVINGVLHGYELKSDKDTLNRLSSQMEIYNSVFDQVTIVVGKSHLFESINLIPDWWGIMVAQINNSDCEVSLYSIREARQNPAQDIVAVASLLWREEALRMLEESGRADGVRSKNRKMIYERLADVLDNETLKYKVREQLCTRLNWRSGSPCMLNGG